MKTNVKIMLFIVAAMFSSNVVFARTWTLTINETIYFDFTGVTYDADKLGVNWSAGTCGTVGYDASGSGKVKSYTFSSIEVSDDCFLFKTQYGGWTEVKWTPPSGKNCVKVNADGKTFSWTTYSSNPTLSFDKEGSGTVSCTVNSSAHTSGTEATIGQTVVLTATPSSASYKFVGWTDDNNSDAFVSINATLTFPMPASNISYTAHFEADRSIDDCANCLKVQ